MIGFLFAFLKNPMTILSLIAAAAVLAAMFFAAPKTFAKVALHPTTWIVILGIAFASGYTHLSAQNETLRTEVHQSQQVQQTKDDTLVVVRKHAQRKQVRQTERERVSDAISNAKPGEAYDDALDEIAKLQKPAPDPADSHPAKRLRDGQGDGVVRP